MTLVTLISFVLQLQSVYLLHYRPAIITSNSVCRYGGDFCPAFNKCIRNMFTAEYSLAKSTCAVLNGSLPCIRNSDQNDAIATRFSTFGCSDHQAMTVWLGNNDPDHSCITSYSNWDPLPTNGNCTTLSTMSTWTPDDCGLVIPFMCIYDVFRACNEGWYYFQHNCYFISTFPDSQVGVDYTTAADYCFKRYNGSELVSIHSEDDNDFLVSLARTQNPNRKSFTWIGLNSSDGQYFEWIDKSEVTYTNWMALNPTNDSLYGCAVMAVYPQTGALGRWYATSCHSIYPTLICKMSENT